MILHLRALFLIRKIGLVTAGDAVAERPHSPRWDVTMDANEPHGVRVVITATAHNGDKIEMLAYPDGGCGLARNGVLIPQTRSIPCDAEQCGVELLKFVEERI